MKASTLFGLTVALLSGLGLLVGAKYTGFFEETPIREEKKSNGFKILVAAHNLIRGTAAQPGDSIIRPLLDSELDFYEKNKPKLLPPLPRAAEFRVLAKSVAAGQPLLEDHFEPQALPETVSARLEPGMRSVSLLLPKEQVAGGLLRTGERVDVLLTTQVRLNPSVCKICQPVAPFTATTVIARNLKIIVKRDTLLTVMQPIPQDKPLSYILEANPYRAALIEYAKSKGSLTLSPSGTSESPTTGAFGSDPDSREYRDEDKRIREFMNNEWVISDGDLTRIFNLKPRPLPVAAAPPPSPPPAKVELMVGMKLVETREVAVRPSGKADLTAPLPPVPPAPAAIDTGDESPFLFGPPGDAGTNRRNGTLR